MGFKCHACRLKAVPVCPYAQADTVLKDQPDREDDIDRSTEDVDHNCPKDLCTSDGLKELHDYNIEGEIEGHSIETQVSDRICLELLEDCTDLKGPGSHSTEKQLDDCNWLKERDSCNKMEELGNHNTEKGPHDHNNPNEHVNHSVEKERADYNFLSELGYHNNVKDLHNGDGPEELGSTEDSSNFVAGKTQSLKELDNHMYRKDLANWNITKELDNHNSLDKFDDHNIVKTPGNHNSMGELDRHNYQKDLGNQNSLNDLDNHKNLKELHSAQNGKFTAVTYTDGFLVEQFNTSLSSKEAMIMTSENDSVKESIALQSKGSREDTVLPAEHEMDPQVPLSLPL